MNDLSNISNNSGPGSAAEPSMEEILASIRRILKEDDGNKTEEAEPDDDVLVLSSEMVAAPADISTATELPVDTGLLDAHDAAPLTTYHEPVHFASEPTIDSQVFDAAPAMAEEAEPAEPPLTLSEQRETEALTDDEPEPAEHRQEEEKVMEHQLQGPDGLIGDEATAAIANTVGTMMRSIAKERAVSVTHGGLTIEDIVREEIKPMLKAWFDTHLPSLVERIVRAEIGRLVDRTQI